MAYNFLFLAAAVGLFAVSWSYPTGAPQETCQLFTANHTGHSAQNSIQYKITVSPASVKPGRKATVTIEGIRGESFKGFFIQGQDRNTKQPIGRFDSHPQAQARHCASQGSFDSATHINSNAKSNIALKWKAPDSYNGQVVFRAVVVETFERFWDNIYSNTVTVAQ